MRRPVENARRVVVGADSHTFGELTLKLDTLVRLRWLAILGQVAAVLFVALVLRFDVPLWRTAGVIAASGLVNLWLWTCHGPHHRFSARASALILGYDLVQLFVLLALTGGLANPFASLFLAPVMVSAAALPQRHTVALGLAAGVLVSVLAVFHLPLPWSGDDRPVLPPVYVAAIWGALLVTIAFAGAYTFRVAEEARQLADALAATERALEREQLLSTVDGMAAAAAHKLGTPLATIAVVVRELDLQLPPGHALKEDIGLLVQESARCRSILADIASLGSDEGGPLGTLSLGQIIEELVEPHRALGTGFVIDLSGDGPQPEGPRNAGLMYALGNIIDNAADFAAGQVTIAARWTARDVRLSIADDGPGFSSAILQRLGEPYVTSRRERLEIPDGERGSGGGLGLGLFIAKTLLERSGGRLSWSNPASGGAEVSILWARKDFPG